MSSGLREAISILPVEDLDRLSQGATAEECAEALSDYAIKLEAERNALKNELSLARASLRCCYNAAAGTLGLATSDSQKAQYRVMG